MQLLILVGEDITNDEEGEDESSVEYSYQYSDKDPKEDVEEANGDDDDASSLSSNSNHSIDVDDKEQGDEVVTNDQDSSQPQTNLSRVGTAERDRCWRLQCPSRRQITMIGK